MKQYNDPEESWSFSGPRITWAVQRLILANVLVFALQLAWDPFEVYLQYRWGWIPNAIDTLLSFQVHIFMHGQIWKPFSYMFLHGNLMHLLMNLLWLYFFGTNVERVLGTRQFFRFYVVCGAVGVLANFVPYAVRHLAGDTVTDPSVMGASGAVMGVLIAFAMTDPDRQFYMFPLPVPINARALVLIVVVMNVISGLNADGISVSTHFGGMLAGYGYMKLLPRINLWQSERRRSSQGQRPKTEFDKVGEAVDNIFRFDEKKRRH